MKFDTVRLLYVSSGGTLYGNPSVIPVPEDQPLWPVSYHGVGKVAVEAFLRVYGGNHGGRVCVLRPSNVYGPGQILREGFGVIRTMLEHAYHGEPMTFWGDGEAIRDFLYVDDFVEACCRTIDSRAPLGVYNVGAGVGHSLNSLRAIMERVTGRELRVRWLACEACRCSQCGVGLLSPTRRHRMATARIARARGERDVAVATAPVRPWLNPSARYV